ncbi:MAG: hypothetical protein CMI55_02970 [Parcubacteria group bacterium]|jgi:hypothetical protein|nr:hypothetical protein [Parcubacteria group bacterium]|tara:strand:+ start:863 stop:1120 length:258 start_codon:yes stop_codon:yes gene_type:complete
MNFGKIDQWILFGGEPLLTGLSLKLKEQRFKVFVVTSDRHSSGFISNSEKITLLNAGYNEAGRLKSHMFYKGKFVDKVLVEKVSS